MRPPTTECLWDYAVRVYARDGVPALCLRLQDTLGVDVDIILTCAWWSAYGGDLDDEGLRRVLASAAAPRARVCAIRQLRRTIAEDRERDRAWDATHQNLLDAELAAERVELEAIDETLGPPPSTIASEPSAARPRTIAAWQCYLRHLGVDDPQGLLPALADRLHPIA